jgi:TetR/AcrR family transcriptional regulator, mexCD-oprJ operon repressor
MGPMAETTTDRRRATAERNVETILDATEALLAGGAVPSTVAVAAEAGLSRPTVYAHFPTREALLEAVVERAIRRATDALATVKLGEGTPLDALDRLVAAAWSELDRHRAVAGVVTEHLSVPSLRHAHEALHAPIAALVARGQADGTFRDDLPRDWLVASYFALMHACGDEVRAGHLAADQAVPTLQATLRGLFAAPRPRPRRARKPPA